MSTAKIHFVHVTSDGEEIEYALAARFEVCLHCHGEGTHVNPAVDGNGLTREDFDADPDFMESYMAGDYDVQCALCKGARVVPVPDPSRWTYTEKRAYVRHRQGLREYQRDYESERWLRMAEAGERY